MYCVTSIAPRIIPNKIWFQLGVGAKAESLFPEFFHVLRLKRRSHEWIKLWFGNETLKRYWNFLKKKKKRKNLQLPIKATKLNRSESNGEQLEKNNREFEVICWEFDGRCERRSQFGFVGRRRNPGLLPLGQALSGPQARTRGSIFYSLTIWLLLILSFSCDENLWIAGKSSPCSSWSKSVRGKTKTDSWSTGNVYFV